MAATKSWLSLRSAFEKRQQFLKSKATITHREKGKRFGGLIKRPTFAPRSKNTTIFTDDLPEMCRNKQGKNLLKEHGKCNFAVRLFLNVVL
ncbi:hypothetical protein [Agriterribacter sp.]|uniref:hypothetical protein n=1 Tax=Agriterribacter sp. TaxID=2821509 RepID=UPI002BEB5A50|nr:hypothetical protein [Agriterribacter sp.]HRP58633.1 hypothetical protein [Agriterribacter sp.]